MKGGKNMKQVNKEIFIKPTQDRDASWCVLCDYSDNCDSCDATDFEDKDCGNCDYNCDYENGIAKG